MGVDKARGDVGAVDVNDVYFRAELLVQKAAFVKDIGDFVVFDINGTMLHNRKSGQHGGIMQADCVVHVFLLIFIFNIGNIIPKGKFSAKKRCFKLM